MIRTLNILAMILILVAGFGLYQLKHNTRQLQTDVETLERQLAEDAEAIRVLRAEWAYLSRPERIEALGNRYLALKAPASTQVIRSLGDIAVREDANAVMAQVDDFRVVAPVLARAPERRPDRPVHPVAETVLATAPHPQPTAPSGGRAPAHGVTVAEAGPSARVNQDDPLAFIQRLRFVSARAEGQNE